ncbi:MAG: hypothetical protein Q8L48_02440 [Archangium sp.]|nr:hypothetical protein [Archangium sp.]
MKYRVRSKDGELEYESFQQLEEAARMGFVDADDELLREGESEWKKVSTLPSLLKRKRGGLSVFRTALTYWIVAAIGAGLFAFWALATGNTGDKADLYAEGITAAFVCAGILFKVTVAAQKRRR